MHKQYLHIEMNRYHPIFYDKRYKIDVFDYGD